MILLLHQQLAHLGVQLRQAFQTQTGLQEFPRTLRLFLFVGQTSQHQQQHRVVRTPGELFLGKQKTTADIGTMEVAVGLYQVIAPNVRQRVTQVGFGHFIFAKIVQRSNVAHQNIGVVTAVARHALVELLDRRRRLFRLAAASGAVDQLQIHLLLQLTQLVLRYLARFANHRQQFVQRNPVFEVLIQAHQQLQQIGVTRVFVTQVHQHRQRLFALATGNQQLGMGNTHRQLCPTGAFVGRIQQLVGGFVLALLIGCPGGSQIVNQRHVGIGRTAGQQAFSSCPLALRQRQQATSGLLASTAGFAIATPFVKTPIRPQHHQTEAEQEVHHQYKRRQQQQEHPQAGFNPIRPPAQQYVAGILTTQRTERQAHHHGDNKEQQPTLHG